jgi:superfamily I DNA/RNA helicase
MTDHVDITIKGIVLRGLKVMVSRYDGFDILTGKRFKTGDQIAFMHFSKLTQDAIEILFPNGRPQSISVRWPVTGEVAPPLEKKVAGKFIPVNFNPNENQMAILDKVLNTESHVLIKALAGSGKTSTLVWLVQELSKRGLTQNKKIIYLAFNKSIQEELAARLQGTGVPAKTTHAFGFDAVKQRFGNNIKPHSGKCAANAFLRIICNDNGLPFTAKAFKSARNTSEYALRSAILELVGYIKSWAICPFFDYKAGIWRFADEQQRAIGELIDAYEIEFPSADYTPEDLIHYACRVVIENLPAQNHKMTEIDFDDMLYLPLVLSLPIPKYDLVLTDESQDFNLCQILILEKLIGE